MFVRLPTCMCEPARFIVFFLKNLPGFTAGQGGQSENMTRYSTQQMTN